MRFLNISVEYNGKRFYRSNSNLKLNVQKMAVLISVDCHLFPSHFQATNQMTHLTMPR